MPTVSNAARPHKLLDRVFNVSISLKGINGVLELLGGSALLFIDVGHIRELLRWISVHAVAAHQHSSMSRWIEGFADRLGADSTTFAAWYLLIHGFIKVGLVWALLRQKTWAYPWMLIVLVIFVTYQCYEIIVHFTWGMLALTVFDIFIVVLTWREWRLHRGRRGTDPGTLAGAVATPL